jgi:crossover junction endodeoxyribonuclease RuvC
MRVLGLDPGTRLSGWGFLEAAEGHIQQVRWGCLVGPRRASRPAVLAHLAAALAELLATWQPQVAVVETPFVARFPKASLQLAETRGALLAALGRWGGEVVEYEPARVKAWVVGHGQAAKSQVAWVVQRYFNLPEAPPADAADALALALCHLFAVKALAVPGVGS